MLKRRINCFWNDFIFFSFFENTCMHGKYIRKISCTQLDVGMKMFSFTITYYSYNNFHFLCNWSKPKGSYTCTYVGLYHMCKWILAESELEYEIWTALAITIPIFSYYSDSALIHFYMILAQIVHMYTWSLNGMSGTLLIWCKNEDKWDTHINRMVSVLVLDGGQVVHINPPTLVTELVDDTLCMHIMFQTPI